MNKGWSVINLILLGICISVTLGLLVMAIVQSWLFFIIAGLGGIFTIIFGLGIIRDE